MPSEQAIENEGNADEPDRKRCVELGDRPGDQRDPRPDKHIVPDGGKERPQLHHVSTPRSS